MERIEWSTKLQGPWCPLGAAAGGEPAATEAARCRRSRSAGKLPRTEDCLLDESGGVYDEGDESPGPCCDHCGEAKDVHRCSNCVSDFLCSECNDKSRLELRWCDRCDRCLCARCQTNDSFLCCEMQMSGCADMLVCAACNRTEPNKIVDCVVCGVGVCEACCSSYPDRALRFCQHILRSAQVEVPAVEEEGFTEERGHVVEEQEGLRVEAPLGEGLDKAPAAAAGKEHMEESGQVDADSSRSRCATCGQKLVEGACFCHRRGARVERSQAARHGRSRSPRRASIGDNVAFVEDETEALTIVGFKIGDGLIRTSDDEWDALRDLVRHRRDIKQEITVLDIRDVYYTQRSCSPCFRHGGSLSNLTQQLRDRVFDPMEHDFLILDVIQASLRGDRRRGTLPKLIYYSLDHRRLKCMKDAGCLQMRARI